MKFKIKLENLKLQLICNKSIIKQSLGKYMKLKMIKKNKSKIKMQYIRNKKTMTILKMIFLITIKANVKTVNLLLVYKIDKLYWN